MIDADETKDILGIIGLEGKILSDLNDIIGRGRITPFDIGGSGLGIRNKKNRGRKDAEHRGENRECRRDAVVHLRRPPA